MNRLVAAIVAVLIGIAAASLPLRATALPGQSLPAFATWRAHQPLLRGMTRNVDELSGRPAFTLLTADHGIAWSVAVATDGTAITSETLGVSTAGGEPGSEPVRQSGAGYGFTFFRTLYGAAIADDFHTAQRTATFTDPANKIVTTYVRGRRYGYTISAGFITLSTFAAYDAEIALTRRCSAHPDSCSE